MSSPFHSLALRRAAINRDRGASHDATPPTPPGIRVRTTAVRRIKHPWVPGFRVRASPWPLRPLARPDAGLHPQGCSTLSTVAPLEQGIEAAQSGGVSVLAEGADLVAAQNVVAEAAQPGEDARVVADA